MNKAYSMFLKLMLVIAVLIFCTNVVLAQSNISRDSRDIDFEERQQQLTRELYGKKMNTQEVYSIILPEYYKQLPDTVKVTLSKIPYKWPEENIIRKNEQMEFYLNEKETSNTLSNGVQQGYLWMESDLNDYGSGLLKFSSSTEVTILPYQGFTADGMLVTSELWYEDVAGRRTLVDTIINTDNNCTDLEAYKYKNVYYSGYYFVKGTHYTVLGDDCNPPIATAYTSTDLQYVNIYN